MEELKASIQELNTDDFEWLMGWLVNTERARRREEAAKQKAELEVIGSLVEAGAVEGAQAVSEEKATSDPDSIPPWVDPGTDHTKMYRTGAVVAHKNRYWLNMVEDRLNSWEPGGEGVYENIWRDITDEVMRAREGAAAPEAEEVPAEGGELTTEGDAAPDGSAERPWPFEVGRTATKGQYITYEGKLFRMAQNHTMVDHYRPEPGLESIFEPV